MTLDELIQFLKEKILQFNTLDVFAYYYVQANQTQLKELDISDFTGEVEQVAIKGYLDEYAQESELKIISKKLSNSQYKKHLSIFNIIGLGLQDDLLSTKYFESLLDENFNSHSLKYKFLIAKVFSNRFERKLKDYLQTQVDTNDSFVLLAKHIYLEESILTQL